MSGRGSGCLFWPLTGISPPSSWCSRSGSWTRTPEGLTLRVRANGMIEAHLGFYCFVLFCSVLFNGTKFRSMVTQVKTPFIAFLGRDFKVRLCASRV